MGSSIAAELCTVGHEASGRAEYESRALSVIAGALTFDVAFFVRAHGIGPARVGLNPAVVSDCADEWPSFARELRPVFAVGFRDGLAVGADVLGEGLFSTGVYRDFIARHDGVCTMLAPLAARGVHLGTLALGRCTGEFGPRARQALHDLLPALRLCELAQGPAGPAYPAHLTPRERDVLDYLRLGYTNPEIARALGRSVNTVRNQLQSLYRKLGATTRAEAVALSLGHHDG